MISVPSSERIFKDVQLAKTEFPKLSNRNKELKDYLYVKKMDFHDRFKMAYVSSGTNIPKYEMLKTIGRGSFGTVILVKHLDTTSYYAMKVLTKSKIVKLKQLDHTLNEKKILQCIDHPFCAYMVECMKDNTYLYFVMPFLDGGEFFRYLRKVEKLPEENSKFYGAQILLALEYLHYIDFAYRDLKPENVVMCMNGYLKLVDFGFCKMVKGRTWTLCGTPEYLAPEVILSKGYSSSVDWWAFGIFIYEMNAGYPPFYSRDQIRLYEKIVAGKFKYPSHFTKDLQHLIRNLLQIDLSRR